jgi:hypothetical protein
MEVQLSLPVWMQAIRKSPAYFESVAPLTGTVMVLRYPAHTKNDSDYHPIIFCEELIRL